MIVKQFAPNFGHHKGSVSNTNELRQRKTSWFFSSKKNRKLSAINGTSDGLLGMPMSPTQGRPLLQNPDILSEASAFSPDQSFEERKEL